MRKNTLLIAVAATALAVGSGTALAQGAPEAGHKAGEAVHQNRASKNAPAEKIQGQASHQKGSAEKMTGQSNKLKSETTGQGASEHSQKMGGERSQKIGRENKELNKNNKATTGQAPSESKSGQAHEGRHQRMGEGQKSPNHKSTTGQAPNAQTTPGSNRTNNARERNEPNRSGQMNERNEHGANENRTGTSTSERSSTSTSTNVQLSSEQRTKIHSIIVNDHSAPRIAHADFEIHVGTVVPRGKVHFAPLPSRIVEIEPSWRGFDYFLVGDQLVVVDPATLRIVAVLST